MLKIPKNRLGSRVKWNTRRWQRRNMLRYASFNLQFTIRRVVERTKKERLRVISYYSQVAAHTFPRDTRYAETEKRWNSTGEFTSDIYLKIQPNTTANVDGLTVIIQAKVAASTNSSSRICQLKPRVKTSMRRQRRNLWFCGRNRGFTNLIQRSRVQNCRRNGCSITKRVEKDIPYRS